MASSFGGTVKLTGESEYTKALKTITSNLTVMASEMKVVSSEYDKNNKSTEAITSRNNVLGKEIEETKKKIDTYTKAITDFNYQQDQSAVKMTNMMLELEKEKKKLEELKNSTTATNEEIKEQEKVVSSLSDELASGEAQYEKNKLTINKYQTQLNNAKADLNNMTKELENNKSNLSENKDAYTNLTEKIENQKDKLNSLKSAYASTVIEQGKNSKSAKELKSEIKELSNNIETNEDKVKKSTEAIDEFTASEDKAGKGSVTMGDLIKANLLSDAIKSGLKGLVSSIKGIANAVSDWMDMANNVEEQEQKFRTALTNTTDATEEDIQSYIKLAEAKEKVGVVSKTAILSGYQELATYTTQKESIEGLTDALLDMATQQYGVSASEEQVLEMATRLGKALSNGDYSGLSKMGYFFTEAEKEAMEFGTEADRVNALLEAIESSVGGMNEALGQTNAGKVKIAQTYIDGMKESIGVLASDTKDKLLAEFLPSIIEISTALTDMVSGDIGVEEGMGRIATGLQTGLEQIVNMLPSVLSVGIDILTKLVEGIISAIPEIIPTVMTIITTLTTTIISMLPQLVQSGIDILLSIVNGIATSLPELIPVVIDTIMLLIETIIDNLDLIIDAGINIILALADGLIEALPDLIDKIPVIIEKLIDAIVNNLPKIIEMGITLIVKLGVGLIKAIPQLISKIPEIIVALVNGLGEGISKIKDVGKNLISGLWNGIKEKWDNLKDKVADFGNGIVNKFKKVFGIESPSKVFKNVIGKNLALGIEEGYMDEMSDIASTITSAIPTDFDLGVNTNYSQSGSLDTAFTKEVLIDAFKEALSGMTFKAFDETFGELVIDKVEQVVF